MRVIILVVAVAAATAKAVVAVFNFQPIQTVYKRTQQFQTKLSILGTFDL